MTHNLEEALGKVSGTHRVALHWFQEHQSEVVLWSVIQEFSKTQSRLANLAKGIYKPEYTDYALSVRVLQDGPYPDREVEYRPDGSWVLSYFQENPDPRKRDTQATNRGLVKCMKDGVPVGVLIKRKPKPGVAYEVLGLGIVTDWQDGYFTIEGFSPSGEAHADKFSDATRLRATMSNYSEPFDAGDDRDLRVRTVSQVAQRRGQAAFRAALLEAYDGKCPITRCALSDVLEAAHIVPYKGEHTNHVQNGLLLRSDIHTLFDLGLLAISEEYRVKLAPHVLHNESYSMLEGVELALPEHEEQRPSADALKRHRAWAGI